MDAQNVSTGGMVAVAAGGLLGVALMSWLIAETKPAMASAPIYGFPPPKYEDPRKLYQWESLEREAQFLRDMIHVHQVTNTEVPPGWRRALSKIEAEITALLAE